MGLPVITLVSDSTGNAFSPAPELRFGEDFAVTRVPQTVAGPARLVVSSSRLPVTRPQSIVPQASVLAAGPATVRFVIAAAVNVALPISTIRLIPHATAAQDASHYARVAVHEYSSAGAYVRSLFDGYAFDTFAFAFASMSTAVFAAPILADYVLPVGSTVIAEWTKVGSGADVLGATWILYGDD